MFFLKNHEELDAFVNKSFFVKNILSESILQLAEALCMHNKCVKFSQLRPWKGTSLWVVGKTGFV